MLWHPNRKGTRGRNRLSVVAPTSQGNKRTEQTKYLGAHLTREQKEEEVRLIFESCETTSEAVLSVKIATIR